MALARKRSTEPPIQVPDKIAVSLIVNGVERQLEVAPSTTLLDALRDHLDLTGTKKGCDHGQCGACTVLVDGRRINSCLTLAVMKDGAEITTIEGLAKRRRAASVAAGLHRPRCVPVRLLHPRTNLLGGRPDRRRQGKNRRRNSRAHERQHLPLRRLSQHCRGDPQGHGAIMINFQYARASDVADAVRMIAADPTAKFIAGGTNLIDLMKEDVERPSRLIDISRLPLKTVEETADGGLRIGALVPNSDLAYHPLVAQRYPLLASAILAGASQQLRNMASTGGNLLQRTRCYYFYDTATPCNKREPGTGCSAVNGLNRMHAILGTSESCIATHPSDMCVALAALDAKVHVAGPAGERAMAFADFHRLPGTTPQRDTNLRSRRDRHGGGASGAGFCQELHLSENPRPPVLCVRAGVGRGGAGARRRHDQAGAAGARRRRAQAVARTRAPRRRCAARPQRRDIHPCGGPACCATPRDSRTTLSRSTWRARSSSAR